jgi:hypothetical protein
MPGSSPSAMILVFERRSGVGSVPSLQMYSARYATVSPTWVSGTFARPGGCFGALAHDSVPGVGDEAVSRRFPGRCSSVNAV